MLIEMIAIMSTDITTFLNNVTKAFQWELSQLKLNVSVFYEYINIGYKITIVLYGITYVHLKK